MGDVTTLTPVVTNTDGCALVYSYTTTSTIKSFDTATGVVTLSSESADGASAATLYSYSVTVTAVSSTDTDTETFTIDFCDDYAPTVSISDETHDIAGDINSATATLSPANTANCELIWTDSGTDSGSALIRSFDATTGVWTFDSASASDQDTLSLTLSVVSATASGTASTSDSFTVTFVKAACKTY